MLLFSVIVFLSNETNPLNSFAAVWIVFTTLEKSKMIVVWLLPLSCYKAKGPDAYALWVLLDRRKYVFIRMLFLNLQCILTANTVDCLGWHLKMSCFLSNETWSFISSFAFIDWKVIYFIEKTNKLCMSTQPVWIKYCKGRTVNHFSSRGYFLTTCQLPAKLCTATFHNYL